MEKSEFSDELKEELSHLLSALKDVGSHLMNTLSSAGHIAKMSLNKASEEWDNSQDLRDEAMKHYHVLIAGNIIGVSLGLLSLYYCKRKRNWKIIVTTQWIER